MKRTLLTTLIGVVIVGIVGVVLVYGPGYFLSPQDKVSPADAIVAISGGDTEARTDEAVRLYDQGMAPVIIFSGAALDPNSPSNASAMARSAREAGVPEAAIKLDENATSTRENAAGVAAIVKQQGFRSIILVTSPYHQRRADIVFRRALGPGIKITGHSSYDQEWRRSHWWATDYSRRLTVSELQKVAYEIVAGLKS